MEEILWNMPAPMVFKISALTHQSLTGKNVMSHRDKQINLKLLEKIEEVGKNG